MSRTFIESWVQPIGRNDTYDRLGNLNAITRAGVQWVYGYHANNPSRLMSVSNLPLTVNATDGYDKRGNLKHYDMEGNSYQLDFDVENRLTSIQVGAATPTTFSYDTDGQRVKATYPDGTVVYTPFPDYEVEVTSSGSTTIRTTYRVAGQIVALQTKVGAAAGVFYYTYTDHLGNVAALSWLGGTFVPNSLARHDPFGNYRTTPTSSVNPALTDHGFTGQRMNNTGVYPTQNVGLIYMNARYYLPEVGRFISADSIVPEPGNPQSFNRYSYSFNNPINYIDPSGHDPLDAAWEEAFIAAHGRAPEWYDRLIRLFSIAFPEEWKWSDFYDSNGNLGPDFEAIMRNPPSSRSWANMEDALTRLSAYYNWNESEIFARDIGTLFAGLPDRASQGTNFAVTGCALGPICSDPADLPSHIWAYLQPTGMPERLRGGDDDSNVHHWGWGVAIGSYLGGDAIGINMAREAYQALATGHVLGNPDLRSDIFLGNRGAFFGDALRVFGPRATPLLYRYFVAEW